jgi:hypothetical protein
MDFPQANENLRGDIKAAFSVPAAIYLSSTTACGRARCIVTHSPPSALFSIPQNQYGLGQATPPARPRAQILRYSKRNGIKPWALTYVDDVNSTPSKTCSEQINYSQMRAAVLSQEVSNFTPRSLYHVCQQWPVWQLFQESEF